MINFRALDCDTCAGLIGQLSELFQSQPFIDDVLGKVKGFLYCDTLGGGAADCVAFVDKYGSAAMPVLGEGLVAEAGTICGALGCE